MQQAQQSLSPVLLQRYEESKKENASSLSPASLTAPALKVESIASGYQSYQAIIALGSIAILFSLILVIQNKTKATESPSETPSEPEPASPPPLPRQDAVLVFGSTGRVGRKVVQSLLASGRTVIAAVRVGSEGKAKEVFESAGIREGRQGSTSSGILFFETGIDVTDLKTLDRPSLWTGVSSVVINLGAVFGPLADGTMGYLGDMNPSRVEVLGGENVLCAMKKHLKPATKETIELLLLKTADHIAQWLPLDDVIMGGQSSSKLEVSPDHQGARWSGTLIVEGGGFCGNRSPPLELSDGGKGLSSFDGISMRVKGDGSTFKINIKTVEQLQAPECTYQATFDTSPGEWVNVEIPFVAFSPVRMASSDPSRPPLDPSKIATFGLVYSRFDFNKSPNPNYHPGPFTLDIEGGISAFKYPRPQILMLSSAGVERNALIGNDEEARKTEIPIVRLNPGGVLNHKYAAEMNIRSSSFPYSIIRSVGMIDSSEGGPFLLEADQGDGMAGFVNREEVAELIVQALSLSEASNKTFEVRRNEAMDARGRKQAMSSSEHRRLFFKLSEDRKRTRAGLRVFPPAVPPPPPATREQTEEILVQVKEIQEKQKELVSSNA